MIPVNELSFEGNERRYLEECIVSGWVSSEGPFVDRFEKEYSSFIGRAHGIAVCNGTAALETALYALGIGAGDEVIMPSFTIISCALACLRLGAIPVLVDIEPEIWTMAVERIEEKITTRTKAIMAVHIFGNAVDMDKVLELARKHNLKVVEDIAEAQGSQYFSNERGSQWRACGALGDIAATSFYANKIITTGEGGMVLTDNDEYARKARDYRNLCFGKEKRFTHEEIGYNFRMSNLQAALGVARLEQVVNFMRIKAQLGEYYKKKLSGISRLKFMTSRSYTKLTYWVYALTLTPESGMTAEELMRRLEARRIGTRPFFQGLHTQPALKRLGLFGREEYLHTENAYTYGLYLPSGLALTEPKIDKVVEALKEALES